MGRGFVEGASPYTAPPIAFSGNKIFFGAMSDGYSAGGVQTGLWGAQAVFSLTTTQTLIALDGPGVMNYFEFMINGGTGADTVFRVIIDDVTCFSATATNNANMCGVLVGYRNGGIAASAINRFAPVTFKNKLTITAKGNSVTTIKTATNWRLTSG